MIIVLSKHEGKHLCQDEARVGLEGWWQGDLSGEKQQGECTLDNDANDDNDDNNHNDDYDDEDDYNDDGKEIYQGRNSRVRALLMMTMMTTMTTMMIIIAMMMVGVVMMMIRSNC